MAQGYGARKDESIAMRVKKPRTKKQLKASADESYGKFGSGKGKGVINKRGGGIAKRGKGIAKADGGVVKRQAGGLGRRNLLEEVGRIDAERMNPNRRAEKSRVIGELNRGYKKGGAIKRRGGGVAKRGMGVAK
jgi:hypothetical protein|tara:strand:- start:3078 stop:3479 length:402 start_codon:yes stop_codon:yes gene_type:complete